MHLTMQLVSDTLWINISLTVIILGKYCQQSFILQVVIYNSRILLSFVKHKLKALK